MNYTYNTTNGSEFSLFPVSVNNSELIYVFLLVLVVILVAVVVCRWVALSVTEDNEEQNTQDAQDEHCEKLRLMATTSIFFYNQ